MDYYFLLLLPVSITLVWLTVFINSGRHIKLHDRLFMLFLLCCVVTYYIVVRSLTEATGNYVFILLDNLETFLGLSICPLLFLYVRSVTCNANWRNWYYLLFAPALLIGLLGSILSFLVGWDRIAELRIDYFAPFTPNPDSLSERLYDFVNIHLFNITLELMALVMISMSVYYIIKYTKRAEGYFTNLEQASVVSIHRFLFSAIVTSVTLFSITIFIMELIEYKYASLIVLSLLISALLWIMSENAYKVLFVERNLDIIDVLEKEQDDVDYSSCTNQRISELLNEWTKRQDLPYCRMGITLGDVADEIGIGTRSLSEYINKDKGMNFRRWINNLRIETAKQMILDNPELKISYIGAVCGFSDLASFSRVFHSVVGLSPQEYRSNIK